MKRGAFLIPLLLLASFVQVLGFVVPANASGPVFVASVSNKVIVGTTVTVTMNGVKAGDNLIIVSLVGSLTNDATMAATDNQTGSYLSAVLGTDHPAGEFLHAQVWVRSTLVSSTHGFLFTITTSGQTPFFIGIAVGEYSGMVANSVDNTASNGAVCVVSPFPTLPSTSFPKNVVAIGGGFSDTSAAAPSAGAGFSLLGISLQSANGGGYGEYDVITGGAGSTQFPAGGCSGTTANAVDVGAIIDSAPPTSVTVFNIGPCNFFQLQCWWYPALFMGLYAGFILMVGTWLRTSPRGKAHLFLSAVTFGSLVAVTFGIMNIVFPLMILILNTIIALRLRG